MKIPVFVSCPSTLNNEQNSSRKMILRELENLRFEPRALGHSDYPTGLPLREVYVLATHCSGGVILGFEQFLSTKGISKRGTKNSKPLDSVPFPTAWNHLEAGILYSLGLPLLVFREDGITGGVFDPGVTDIFVNKMPTTRMSKENKDALTEVFLKWQAKVREHYYQETRRSGREW